MKRYLMLVYAVCATLMITGSLLWFVFTLRSDSQLGKAEALKNFKGFTKHTANILYEPYIQSDPVRLQTLLEQLCHSHHKHIQTVLIRSGNTTIFVWPQGTDIFSCNGQNTVEVRSMPLFLTAAQTHLPANNNHAEITIHAALQTLSVENIFNRGQTVFILILILFLMTITLLIVSYVDLLPAERKIKYTVEDENNHIDTSNTQNHTLPKENTAPTASYEDHQDPKTPNAFSTKLESLDNLHIYEHATDQDAEAELLDEEPSAAHSPSTENFNAENYGSFENYTQSAKVHLSTPPVQPIVSFENTPLADATDNDKHSFERAKLIEELSTAITETTVAEEDLTLLFIHADDLAHNQQVIHSMRTTLEHIHKIFIFNENTLGFIIFYAPLERAMQIASKLYDTVYSLLEAPNKNSLGIGLTTRAGRLIPAYRMIEEASAAIEKAIEEGADPIVAFRVNPEKYRRCLARLS